MLLAQTRAVRLVLLIWACMWAAAARAQPAPGVVQFNDNREAAGTAEGRAVAVDLVAGQGEWFPDGENYPAIPIQAFGQDGQPMTIPGPLLRVPAGTELVVSVRNAISDATLEVHGLYTRPAESDPAVTVPPGETRTVRFNAGEPGTYFYWATTTGAAVNQRTDLDSQLNGALIVDDRAQPVDDRVFVLGEWFEPVEAPGTGQVLRGFAALAAGGRATFTINGRSWPTTERLAAEVGEAVEWRWVNPTTFPHPLHLHGHYFTVVATGSLLRDNAYTPEETRQVVTELVRQARTMRMTATPERAGNWLFHCHISAHMSAEHRGPSVSSAGATHDHAEEGMAGMVLGITVTGESVPADILLRERRLTMVLDRVPDFFGPDRPGIGVSFHEARRPVTPRSTPGPPLLLSRGQPVRIAIENHLDEPTSIHWHGMELESYFDGVAGFSGTAGSVTPPIPVGESFEARFTPPRSGTFIYHSHMSDERQLPAGLYGAMIVSEPDAPFDPGTDTIVVVGLYGGGAVAPNDTIAINGQATAAFELRAGVTHRLRLVNITANNVGFAVTLRSPTEPVTWRAVAKDGADLPASQQVSRPADAQPVAVGETYDFEWHPSTPGPYWLEVRRNDGEWMAQARVTVMSD